ncbi:MAG TPA: hypothetical protein VMY41_18040 [Thermohalobaculum sp.]|nr:hypothetical protein [Thermohalobaculum sp.]
MTISLPNPGRGRRSAESESRYQCQIEEFCDAILDINSRLDFRVSSRGWCYILEEHGLGKGDFDRAQRIINQCRKDGPLPIDICADDGARQAIHLDIADASVNPYSIDDEVERELEDIENARQRAIDMAGWSYSPHGFWRDQHYYLEMLVEKVDLMSLFSGICADFCIPIANNRGWGDINGRAAMMRRFANMEAEGKRCVLLYCGDHDPAGLHISESLRANLADIKAVGWRPDNLIIDRFGLNAEFVEEHRLSWIDGLETGSGGNLASPRHHDHKKPYVQDYIARFGAKKVEANALVARPEAGRELCRKAIAKYVDEDAPRNYRRACQDSSREINARVMERLGENG